MSSFRKYLAVLSCASVLAGCAATKDTALYTLPAGSQIKVNQELSTSGGNRLIIQGGKVLERRDVNVVTPYCQFSLRRSGEETREPLVIKPGVFSATKSYRQQDWSWAEGLQFAGDTDRSMSTIVELSSDDQPEVTSLVCSRWGSFYVGGWVTIAEMRTTLNPLVELLLTE